MPGAKPWLLVEDLDDGEAPKARLPGSLAGALWAVGQGAQILRVLDVPETRQVPEGYCPVCWSTDLEPVIPWHQRMLVVLLGFFGATFPTSSDEVKCGACGYRKH